MTHEFSIKILIVVLIFLKDTIIYAVGGTFTLRFKFLAETNITDKIRYYLKVVT